MKPLLIIACLAALAGCGVDGEPVQPQASADVMLSSSGMQVGGLVGIRQGPVSLSLGF